MKRIIAPLALALLSTVAIADDNLTLSSHVMDQIRARNAEFRLHQTETLKQMDQRQHELNEKMARHWEEQRKNINKPINQLSKQKANSKSTDVSVETTETYQQLPAWNNVNYKNFTKKTIAFVNPEDCVIARDYAMTQVNGKLIINKRGTLYSVVQAISNNTETRISCKPLSDDSAKSMIDFNLFYETATLRSNDEVNEIEMATMKEQENARKQREDTIKSKVDNVLNRNILGTSYKLYEPK